jgi:hypothetical protein
MPRGPRCLLPGVACHITQRGVDRCETFSSGEDRHTYLGLLRQNLEDTNVRILAYCLMSNHVHFDRRARTPRFDECPDAASAWPVRAVLQRTCRSHRTPLAKSFFRLHAGGEPSLERRDLCGTKPPAGADGGPRGGFRLVADDSAVRLRACTYAERPFGDEAFVDDMSRRFGRYWNRGRPNRRSRLSFRERSDQFGLFDAPGSPDPEASS